MLMVITLSFPSEKVQSKFIELLQDDDSEIAFVISEELEAALGKPYRLVKVSKEEFEIVVDDD